MVAKPVSYDSNYEEVAAKVRLDVKPMDNLSLFIMGGYGTDDNLLDDAGNAIDAHGRGFYKRGNWAVWGGGTYTINEKTSFNAQLSYDEGKNFGVAANIAYEIVKGFKITAEVDYLDVGEDTVTNWTNADRENSIGGVLRF
ncbi:porin [Mesorhizobium sp. M1272]|uniref:porin n=1 Tax=Mesorhizobium sp. M1272 TaxID=2957074 RepID=UPI003335BA29